MFGLTADKALRGQVNKIYENKKGVTMRRIVSSTQPGKMPMTTPVVIAAANAKNLKCFMCVLQIPITPIGRFQ